MTRVLLPCTSSHRALYIRAEPPVHDHRYRSPHRNDGEHDVVAAVVAPSPDTPRAATLAFDALDGSSAPACTPPSTSFDAPPPTRAACTNPGTPYIAVGTPCCPSPERRPLRARMLGIGPRVRFPPRIGLVARSRIDRVTAPSGLPPSLDLVTLGGSARRRRGPPVDLRQWIRSVALSGSDLHRR